VCADVLSQVAIDVFLLVCCRAHCRVGHSVDIWV